MTRQDLSVLDRDMFQGPLRLIQEAMAHGITNDMIYGGLEEGQSVLQGLHVAQAIKNCAIATRRVTWDGRVFRYSKSGGVCYTGQGSAFYQDKAIAANCAAAVLAGASTITFASQTFTVDELKGGYISVFGNPDSAPDNASCPFRRIISNTACNNGTVTITVDQPFDRAINNAQFCEVYYNPYADLRLGTSGTQGFAGLAAVYVTAASLHFWCQTWGPVWIAPQVASFSGGSIREAYFRHDGSIEGRGAHDGTNKQRAGFIIPSGFTAGPLLMLQISP